MDERFSQILSGSPGPQRTASLARWVQGLYRKEKDRPVLVGGAAVELLTGGAFTTGDLDFVGSVPSAVADALKLVGFTREGRHWFHEEERIFLEFPSATLRAGEEARVRVFGGCPVLIVTAEDLIVDRLAAWVPWNSALDGVNAYLLYRAVEAELDLRRLEDRAAGENVHDALASVKDLYTRYGGVVPEDDVVEAWAMRGQQ
jgi:hypothetical protein